MHAEFVGPRGRDGTFAPAIVVCDGVQPFETHIGDFQPETCICFSHVDGWIPAALDWRMWMARAEVNIRRVCVTAVAECLAHIDAVTGATIGACPINDVLRLHGHLSRRVQIPQVWVLHILGDAPSREF